ncbi:hypothetical protein Hanom_Chr01g00039761 [Helianthus anomalus]
MIQHHKCKTKSISKRSYSTINNMIPLKNQALYFNFSLKRQNTLNPIRFKKSTVVSSRFSAPR